MRLAGSAPGLAELRVSAAGDCAVRASQPAAMPFFGKKENRQEGKKIPYKSGEKIAKEGRRLTSSASNVEEVYDMKEVLGT